MTDQQVDEIARRVLGRMSPGGESAARPSSAAGPSASPSSGGASSTSGLFPDVDSAVKAATQAYQVLDGLTLAARNKIIASIRECMLANAETLAREAHAETGLGRWEDKVVKNRLVT